MAGSQLLPQVTGRPRLCGAAGRLDALLRAAWARPFEWGAHDCALFAADAVLAQTGVDPAAPLRGRYSNAVGAGRLVRQLGGLPAIVGAALGAPLRSPLLACVGDVGYTHSQALAVCIGERWVCPGARGLVLLPLAGAATAWRVGCA